MSETFITYDQKALSELIGASFLFTTAEKESLALLCGSPEHSTFILPLLEELLHPIFESEARIAPALSSSVKQEFRLLVQEEELRERSEESTHIDTVFV